MEYEFNTQSDCTYFSPAEHEILANKNRNNIEESDLVSNVMDTTESVDNSMYDTDIIPNTMDIDCVEVSSKILENMNRILKSVGNLGVDSTSNNDDQSQIEQLVEDDNGTKNDENNERNDGELTENDEKSSNLASNKSEVEVATPTRTTPKLTLEQFKYLLDTNLDVTDILNEIQEQVEEEEEEEEEEERVEVKNYITISDIGYVRNKSEVEYRTITEEEWMKMGAEELFRNIPE